MNHCSEQYKKIKAILSFNKKLMLNEKTTKKTKIKS